MKIKISSRLEVADESRKSGIMHSLEEHPLK